MDSNTALKKRFLPRLPEDAEGKETHPMRYIFFLLMAVLCAGCDTPYTHPLSVDDWVKTQGDDTVCLDDGFDTVCIKTIPGAKGEKGERGERGKSGRDGRDGATVLLEIEVPMEVKVPVEIKKLYAVTVKPNETIQTPVGTIQTDATGAVVSAPEGVRLTSVTVQEDDDTSEKPDTPQGGVDTDNTPEKPNLPQGGGDGHSMPQSGGYVVYSELVNGRMQSGVIHSDYVVIDGDTITFTSADGEVDEGDTVREYVKVETGLTYEQASKRAPEILSE